MNLLMILEAAASIIFSVTALIGSVYFARTRFYHFVRPYRHHWELFDLTWDRGKRGGAWKCSRCPESPHPDIPFLEVTDSVYKKPSNKGCVRR